MAISVLFRSTTFSLDYFNYPLVNVSRRSLLKAVLEQPPALSCYLSRIMEATKYQEVRLLKDDQPDASDSESTSEALFNKTKFPRKILLHLFMAYFINLLLVILIVVLLLSPHRVSHDLSLGNLYSEYPF